MAGAFITLEGIDGCGKSTQLRLLTSELRARGLEIVTTRATGGLMPNLTLLFDLSVAESAVRTRRRLASKNTDRLDIEDAEFHTRVRNAYLEIAKAEPERFRVVDARGAVQETHQMVMDIVMPFLQDRGF